MATTDVKTNSLIINQLTKAQYNSIANPQDTELYFISDDDTSGLSVTQIYTGSLLLEMGGPYQNVTSVSGYTLLEIICNPASNRQSFIVSISCLSSALRHYFIYGIDYYAIEIIVSNNTLQAKSVGGDFNLVQVNGVK